MYRPFLAVAGLLGAAGVATAAAATTGERKGKSGRAGLDEYTSSHGSTNFIKDPGGCDWPSDGTC